MPLTDYSKYNAEIARFEKSKLFELSYKAVLDIIKMSNKPVLSRDIEYRVGITGGAVRRLIHFARCKGAPIGSSEKGYFWALNGEELEGTIAHLEERMTSLLFVIRKLKLCYNHNGQSDLFTEGGSNA